jgi:glycerol uptake facilitator-like aquaporin
MLGPVYALMQITSNILASAVVYTLYIKVWNFTSGQLIRTENNPELYVKSGV